MEINHRTNHKNYDIWLSIEVPTLWQGFFADTRQKKKKNKLANLKKKIELDALEFIKNKIAVFQKP